MDRDSDRFKLNTISNVARLILRYWLDTVLTKHFNGLKQQRQIITAFSSSGFIMLQQLIMSLLLVLFFPVRPIFAVLTLRLLNC